MVWTRLIEEWSEIWLTDMTMYIYETVAHVILQRMMLNIDDVALVFPPDSVNPDSVSRYSA